MAPIQGAWDIGLSGNLGYQSVKRLIDSKDGCRLSVWTPSKVLELRATDASQQPPLSHGNVEMPNSAVCVRLAGHQAVKNCQCTSHLKFDLTECTQDEKVHAEAPGRRP